MMGTSAVPSSPERRSALHSSRASVPSRRRSRMIKEGRDNRTARSMCSGAARLYHPNCVGLCCLQNRLHGNGILNGQQQHRLDQRRGTLRLPARSRASLMRAARCSDRGSVPRPRRKLQALGRRHSDRREPSRQADRSHRRFSAGRDASAPIVWLRPRGTLPKRTRRCCAPSRACSDTPPRCTARHG